MINNDKTVGAKIRVTGNIQRVGYRYFVQNWAEDFGLGGWVKNKSDGSVIMQLEGRKDNVEKLLTELKEGTENVVIENIKVDWLSFENKFRNFKVIL
ncbi:MAG: acylphosphatase [Nitrospinae bacterium]|nr:acylphosphatase [Nitrospinota bacterium]